MGLLSRRKRDKGQRSPSLFCPLSPSLLSALLSLPVSSVLSLPFSPLSLSFPFSPSLSPSLCSPLSPFLSFSCSPPTPPHPIVGLEVPVSFPGHLTLAFTPRPGSGGSASQGCDSELLEGRGRPFYPLRPPAVLGRGPEASVGPPPHPLPGKVSYSCGC